MADFENKKDEVLGSAKEKIGEATGNTDLENEGKADQVKSDVKEAASEAVDAVKDKANEVIGKLKGD
ncbi:CsbD family protein [Corynebacterium lizhenjunii]|uniref:CsbD family protein n=1 Tax=Corynebacterium lizhenjunii TaxID=2709394 RepID=A0A7T0KEY7_9CORY|nr:CsbD family protein [Corynebacterium lizhenjunii]QPK79289.1 CsbD family protein [Corynebacterium lizhenjunii]